MARVFLIDDDPVFAGLVRQRLEELGHSLVFNYGAFGALTAVRQMPYDVILVDVRMPDIEGPKLVELFRNRGVGRARIVLISTLGEEALKRATEAHGAHGYFCKEWGLERLVSLIARAEQTANNRGTLRR
jgi:CheY-like chemotaxis protein